MKTVNFILLLILLITNTVFSQKNVINIQFPSDMNYTITIVPNAGRFTYWKLYDKQVVDAGSLSTFSIPDEILPAELMIQLEYANPNTEKKEISNKIIIVNNNNIDINVLKYNNELIYDFNNPNDENKVLNKFFNDKHSKINNLDVVSKFLATYTNPKNTLYKAAIKQYKIELNTYNNWVKEQIINNKNTFAKYYFELQKQPEIDWSLDYQARTKKILSQYLQSVNWNDTTTLKITELANYMNTYVNLYSSIGNSDSEKDSLLLEAAKNAIEYIKPINNYSYGWITDYFYNGFSGIGNFNGIMMLDDYYQDPNCKTMKRIEVDKRINTIKTLVEGADAPDFLIKNSNNETSSLRIDKIDQKYKLVLFWSADCTHCQQLVNKMYPDYEENPQLHNYKVYAVSLDFTETEIPVYRQYIKILPRWTHIETDKGTNSDQAIAYGILSTPTMFLIDAQTNKIVFVPKGYEDLVNFLKNN